MPAIAWPTTVWPLIQLGLNPIFVDICEDTLAIDLIKAQEKINLSRRNIKAIFTIHPLGRSISHQELDDFSSRNGLVQINDVCESLGAWIEGKHTGTTGIAASFSFYFSHHITTMEGGGVATNDDELADDLRSIRSHGWSRDRLDCNDWVKDVSQNDSKFLFVSTGYNIRPMEIQAAIGIEQIRSIDEFVKKRISIARAVSKALKNSNLKVIGENSLENSGKENEHSWMLIPIKCADASQKAELIKCLSENGIETRPVLTGNFLSQPAIEKIDKHHENPENFPAANRISDTALLIGAHHDLTEEQVEFLQLTFEKFADRL